MEFEMEELVPSVGKLARLYTGAESTSITYERAEALMEAVLYCIHELELAGEGQIAVAGHKGKMTAADAYEAGAALVKEKTRAALELYTGILNEFNDFGNRCLRDTFVKGLPQFFGRYDVRFRPQDEILTLDYPVLRDISGYEGIDKVYEFIRCVGMEQRFLGRFCGGAAKHILSRYQGDYRDMIDNVCGIVFTAVMGRMLAETPWDQEPDERDHEKIRNICGEGREALRGRIVHETERLVRQYYGGDEELLAYLTGAAGEAAARIEIYWQKPAGRVDLVHETTTFLVPTDSKTPKRKTPRPHI